MQQHSAQTEAQHPELKPKAATVEGRQLASRVASRRLRRGASFAEYLVLVAAVGLALAAVGLPLVRGFSSGGDRAARRVGGLFEGGPGAPNGTDSRAVSRSYEAQPLAGEFGTSSSPSRASFALTTLAAGQDGPSSTTGPTGAPLPPATSPPGSSPNATPPSPSPGPPALPPAPGAESPSIFPDWVVSTAQGVGSFVEGAVCGNFCDDTSFPALVGQTAVGLIPIVGQVADARDTVQAIGDVIANHDLDSAINLGTTLAAWVPGFDAVKGGGRAARRALTEEEQAIGRNAPHPDEPTGPREQAPGKGALSPTEQAADDAARRQLREQAELAEIEAASPGTRQLLRNEDDLRRLEATAPRADAPPPRADPAIWKAYVEYNNERLAEYRRAFETGGARPEKPPLTWEAYSSHQSVVARGRVFQDSVTRQLRASHPELDIRSDVGISNPKYPKTLFPDQVAVDREAQRAWEQKGRPPGEVPKVETFSTKSRDFREMSDRDVQAQVKEDIREAKNKYSGEFEIRRASETVTGPSSEQGGSIITLKVPPHPLYGTKVEASKVTLIYDSDLMTAAQQASIERSAGDGVSIEFRSGSAPRERDGFEN